MKIVGHLSDIRVNYIFVDHSFKHFRKGLANPIHHIVAQPIYILE